MFTAKIGVIGDRDSVAAFHALGIEVFYAASADEAKEALRKIIDKGIALIFVTETNYEALRAQIEEYEKIPFPTICPLPAAHGGIGLALKEMREAARKAVGIDIWGD